MDVFLSIYSTACACGVTPELRFQPRELNEAEEDLLKQASGRGFFLTINSKTLIPVHLYNIGESHYGNYAIFVKLVGATLRKITCDIC